jgi:hypothetical protein
MESHHENTFSHELRLNRASYHLQSLRNQVREWLEQDPYHYVTEPDLQGGKTLAKVRFSIPPPVEFRLTIGDCLHNLRASLDNMVYELAVEYTGIHPLPERVAQGLEFPIFGNRTMKPNECRRKIGYLDPGAQAIIKELQPYRRGEEYASDPLWKLHKLSNVDKHRVPHIALMAVSTFSDFPNAPHLPGALTINLGPFRDGAEIASYATTTGEEFSPEEQIDPLLSFGIVFDQESTVMSGDVIVALSWLHNHVTNRVVPRLEPFLPQ